MKLRPMLIGQAPGPGANRSSTPDEILGGKAGKRIADLAGITYGEYLLGFTRSNLIGSHQGKSGKGDRFPIELARKNAVTFLMNGIMANRKVVFLGQNVARAFNADDFFLFTWYPGCCFDYAVAPHPSGVSHWWNDPQHVKSARLFWRELVEDEI